MVLSNQILGALSWIALSKARRSHSNLRNASCRYPRGAGYGVVLGAPRLSGNPWNPGQLVKRIIQMGASSNEAATKVWQRLHEALCVDTNDDVWACWLQEEFELRRIGSSVWQSNALPFLEGLPSTDRTLFQYPAKQFVADLGGIISAKSAMTRRQWISLLEAVLRIGTVSHVLWLCDVSDRIWRVVRGVMEGPLPMCQPPRRTLSRRCLQ